MRCLNALQGYEGASSAGVERQRAGQERLPRQGQVGALLSELHQGKL